MKKLFLPLSIVSCSAFISFTFLSCGKKTLTKEFSDIKRYVNIAGQRVETVGFDWSIPCSKDSAGRNLGIPDRSGDSVAQIVYAAKVSFERAGGRGFPNALHKSGVTPEMRRISWGSPSSVIPLKRIVDNYKRKAYTFDIKMGGHEGIDLNAGYQAGAVRAAADGVVRHVLNSCSEGVILCGSGYGNQIVIQHKDRDGNLTQVHSRYAHLVKDSAKVRPGQNVNKGGRQHHK